MECGFDTYKNALIENLVILFVFFCAVEPIYSFFKPIGFFDLIYIILQLHVCMYVFNTYLVSAPLRGFSGALRAVPSQFRIILISCLCQTDTF